MVSFRKKTRTALLTVAAAAGLLAVCFVPGIAAAATELVVFQSAFTAVAALTVAALAGWLLTARHMKRKAAAESRKFATLLEAAPEVIIGVDDDGLIRFANAHVRELFGYGHAELTGCPVELLIPDRFRVAHVESRAQYVERPNRRPMGSGMALRALRRDGTEVPVEISLSRIETLEGPIVLCIVRDVTEQTRTRGALVQANERLRASLAETGRRANELRQLRKMAELLQCCMSEPEVHAVLTRSIARLLPQTCGGLYLLNASRNLVELAKPWGDENARLAGAFEPHTCWALRRARVHRSRAGEMASRCDHASNEGAGFTLCVPLAAHGETIGVVCVHSGPSGREQGRARRQLLRAIAEQGAIAMASLRLRDALRVQSTRDPLTGLYNRRFLDECIDRELSASLRSGSPLSVLMLDLDHFKQFNDTFGHQCGDHALRDVAATLNRAVRRSDIVCRFGGEELVVLLPGTSSEQACVVAEKLRVDVERLVIRHHDEVLGGLTMSIGAATSPGQGRSSTELLRAADVALYAAKRGGRNRVVAQMAIPAVET
ncbi:MAG: diguanylate cyclase [Gammaproteobacteria bacterium]